MKHIAFFKVLIFLAFMPIAVIAQDASATAMKEKIVAIGDEACECTKEVSLNQHRDSIVSKINSCITSGIMSDQMKKILDDTGKMTVEAVQAKNDTTVGQSKNYRIILNENFDEIQQYMFENCPRVKTLMAANNQQSKKSMSKNKKALAYYEEGVAYAQKEQYDMAVVSYNRAVKADSKFAFAWDNMGICYRRLGKYNEAIKCYAKSLEIDPEGKMPLQNTAIAYEYLNDFKNASATYERFIKQYPDDPEGYYGAGRTFFTIEDYRKGVDYLFKAYKMYSEAKSPYINDAQQLLANCYNTLKDKNQLEIFYEAAKNNDIEIN